MLRNGAFSQELCARTLTHLASPVSSLDTAWCDLLTARRLSRAWRRASASLLGQELTRRFVNADWAVRLRALRVLERLASAGSLEDAQHGTEHLARAVAELIDDVDGRVRETAVNVIGPLVNRGSGDIAECIAVRLEHSDPFVKKAAEGALKSIADRGLHSVTLKAVQARLTHFDSSVRGAAVSALGRLLQKGDATGYLPLFGCLADSETSIRYAGLQALQRVGAQGDQAAIAQIIPCLQDAEVTVRQAAAAALNRIALRGDTAVTAALAEGLSDPAWSVRRSCAESLGIVAAHGDASAITALEARRRCRDEHTMVVRAAGEAQSRVAGVASRR